MGAWPFLMAASREHDYQVVLCPGFLTRAGQTEAFKKKLSSKLRMVTANTVVEQVSDPKLGDVGVAYRVDVAHLNGSELLDRDGRRIHRIYGLVFQRPLPENKTQDMFHQSERIANEAFARFCAAKNGFEAMRSEALDMADQRPERVAASGGDKDRSRPDRQSRVDVDRWKIATAVAVVASVAGILGNVWLFSQARTLRDKVAGFEVTTQELASAIKEINRQKGELDPLASSRRRESAANPSPNETRILQGVPNATEEERSGK